MLNFAHTISGLRMGWNEIPLTEADFFRLCKRKRVSVVFLSLGVRGYYYRKDSRDYIAIKKGMAPMQELFVMFHELAHCLFHTPSAVGETALFSGKRGDSREEMEADAFACGALLPITIFSTTPPDELVEEHGYPNWLIRKRLRIYERYGI